MPDKIKHIEGKYKAITSRLVMMCEDSELKLYLLLKFHAIEKHDCFPKISTLIEMTGPEDKRWSKNKVLRTISEMEQSKRLDVDRQHRKSNIYDISWYDQQNELGFLGCQNGTQQGAKTEPKLGAKTEPQQLGSINNKEVTIASPEAPQLAKRTKLDPNEPQTLEQFVASCAENKQRRIQIIGMWAETVSPGHTTRGEWEVFLRRCLRPAANLAPFSDEKLQNGFDRLEEAIKAGWLTTYSLDTLFKFTTNTYATTATK
jgi:hypothetical protein